jgi:hypothetical protein
MFRADWLIILLACVAGGWMIFDGAHALYTGDFVTRSTGDYAGHLGPWSKILQAVGLDPRSTLVKVAFVVIGALWIAAAIIFALGYPGSRTAMLIMAIATLWYLPFGTLVAVVQIVLLTLLLR